MNIYIEETDNYTQETLAYILETVDYNEEMTIYIKETQTKLKKFLLTSQKQVTVMKK